jgi:hypothetical protein
MKRETLDRRRGKKLNGAPEKIYMVVENILRPAQDSARVQGLYKTGAPIRAALFFGKPSHPASISYDVNHPAAVLPQASTHDQYASLLLLLQELHK